MDMYFDNATTQSNTNTNSDKNRLKLFYEKLVAQGYEETKILQALVATSLESDRAAAHWILNHCEDQAASSLHPREYYFYLCPVNDLLVQFEEFWSSYRSARGWSPSMESVPHVSLVAPFEAVAKDFINICHAFNTVSRFYAECSMPERLQPRVLPSKISDTELFLELDVPNEKQALLELGQKFAEICCGAGLRVKPLNPPFRMSLCSSFQQTQYPQIQREITEHFSKLPELHKGTAWQLKLYSRDVRLINGLTGQLHPMYRQLTDWPPSEQQHRLCFNCGDLIALIGNSSPPQHGWGLGFNCHTGCFGSFPLLASQRVPSCTAWALHKVANISGSASRRGSVSQGFNPCPGPSGSVATALPDCTCCALVTDAAIVQALVRQQLEANGRSEKLRPLQLHVMHHAEQLDAAVGSDWFAQANRFDINIPELLPSRPRREFKLDPPLSVIGQFMSRQIGQSLAGSSVRYAACYCSPALRCLQTARLVLQGCGQPDLPLRVEPLLYDQAVANSAGSGDGEEPCRLLPLATLRKLGFNIDTAYEPAAADVDAAAHADADGSEVQFSNGHTTQSPRNLTAALEIIISANTKAGGTVLVVSHEAALLHFACSLLRRSCRKRAGSLPFNSLLCLERKDKRGWCLVPSPIPSFTIKASTAFDAKDMLHVH